MDDIMILFHDLIVDLGSFNETYFGIFNEKEREPLRKIFIEEGSMPFKFFGKLSADQKQCVTTWACQRSRLSVNQLIESLTEFVNHLKTISYTVYPTRVAVQPTEKKKDKKKDKKEKKLRF